MRSRLNAPKMPVVQKRLIVPRSFRGATPEPLVPQDALKIPKPPSLIAEHRGVAVVFAILSLALAAYFIKSILAAPPRRAPAAATVPAPPAVAAAPFAPAPTDESAPQSVYIDVVPAKPKPKSESPATP